MRLLYLHNAPLDSEKANIVSILHLCDSFSRLGIDVTLAVPKSNRPSSIEEVTLVAQGIIGRAFSFSITTYPRMVVFGRFSNFGSYYGAMKAVKKTKADICYTRVPILLQSLLRKGIPTIFESHNALLHNRYAILDTYWKRKLLGFSRSNSLAMVITVSQALANYWIKRGLEPEKVVTFHDGFDMESFRSTRTREDARKELGLKSNGKIVAYAGSLYKDRMIESILRMGRLFQEVLFLIVGGPEERRRYFNELCRTQCITNIDFVGHIHHHKVKDYLFAADILLMIWTHDVPTINYCSPLKMFEYMAAGRVIVGHGFPTIKEVLSDGINAYLADPDSFHDLCAKLENALKEEYPSNLAERARKLALSEYSWDLRARRILTALSPRLKILLPSYSVEQLQF